MFREVYDQGNIGFEKSVYSNMMEIHNVTGQEC